MTLKGIKPPIWRRFLVPGDYDLGKLHEVLQIVMGWTNTHLHQFLKGGVYYSDPRFGLDDEDPDVQNEKRFTVRELLPAVGSKLEYEYDFGDSWVHAIVVEKIAPPDASVALPVCLKGVRACPPEDCGGVWGYAELLDALAVRHAEGADDAPTGSLPAGHLVDAGDGVSDALDEDGDDDDSWEDDEIASLLEWAGDFDPDAFDLAAVNRKLQLAAGPRRHQLGYVTPP